MLLLKLVLTPLLTGLVSFAGRRWGPVVSGWLVGLPLTSGPIALFLALELGNTFAAKAAQGSLAGLISLAAFCLIYNWLSFHIHWLACMSLGWCAFFVVTFFLQFLVVPLLITFVGVLSCLALTLRFSHEKQHDVPSVKPVAWDIPLRMIVATMFVLTLTGFANLLGPRLSGLLAPFPIYATILAVFTHSMLGAYLARRLLRGVITGAFSFAVFFLTIAELVVPLGIGVAFSLATLFTLLLHGLSFYLLRTYKFAQ